VTLKPAPAFDRALLADYASAALGRSIRPEDPEVDEYQEALDAHTFARGGRTNTGYYLDVMITGIPGTSLKPKLKSANEIMRMNLKRLCCRFCLHRRDDLLNRK
jgi:hypothetical protein